jgi:hypothetical protein
MLGREQVFSQASGTLSVSLQSPSSGWALIVLIGVITPARFGAADATTPAPTPDDGQAYFFTWSGTARGSESGDNSAPSAGLPGVQRSTATAQGSAVVKFDRFGSGTIRALRVSESYQYDRYSPAGLRQVFDTYVPYGPWHDHESLIRTDDTNWARLGSSNFFQASIPRRRADGTWWIMVKPAFQASCLRTEIFADLSAPCKAVGNILVCPAPQASKIGVVGCSPSTEIFASDAGGQSNIVLEANTPAPDYFYKHAHYVGEAWRAGYIVGPNFKTDIDWTIEVRRAGPCRAAGVTPLIDQSANSTIPDDIVDEDVSMGVEQGSTSISPDTGVARLNVRVTCEQVPVQNARVEIKVVAEKATGGHDHDSGAGGRPRGSLTWQGAETKLTDTKPSIQTTTDADGQVHFTFKPGKAASCPPPGPPPNTNCPTIGIAGIYEITATSVRFTLKNDVKAVTAEVPGLTPLDPISHLVDDAKSAGHKATDYATATTAQKLAQFADAFQNAQVANSVALAECQKLDPNVAPWGAPRPLWVIDISLPLGGLYDYLGTWGTPHQTHGAGVGVDFSINSATRAGATPATAWPLGGPRVPVCDGLATDPQGWLMMTMMRVGANYGDWDKYDLCTDYRNAEHQPPLPVHCPGDPKYHLNVKQ